MFRLFKICLRLGLLLLITYVAWRNANSRIRIIAVAQAKTFSFLTCSLGLVSALTLARGPRPRRLHAARATLKLLSGQSKFLSSFSISADTCRLARCTEEVRSIPNLPFIYPFPFLLKSVAGKAPPQPERIRFTLYFNCRLAWQLSSPALGADLPQWSQPVFLDPCCKTVPQLSQQLLAST